MLAESEMPVEPEIAASVVRGKSVERGMSGPPSGPVAGPNSLVGYAPQKELPAAPAGVVLSYRSFDADPELSTVAEPGIVAPAAPGCGIPARSCSR